jgi:hypothetical protein
MGFICLKVAINGGMWRMWQWMWRFQNNEEITSLTVGLLDCQTGLCSRDWASEWVNLSESSSGPIPSSTQSGCVCNVSAIDGMDIWLIKLRDACHSYRLHIYCGVTFFLGMMVSNLLYILCVCLWMCMGVWKTVERSQWFVSRHSILRVL